MVNLFSELRQAIDDNNKSQCHCLLTEIQVAIQDEIRTEKERYNRDVFGVNNEGDPIGGEPVGGYANDLTRAKKEIEKLSQQTIFVDVEDLANFIRAIDGNHTMGTAKLAEEIVGFLSRYDQRVCPSYDLDKMAWESIKKAAAESKWMPSDYCADDWQADLRNFLINGVPDYVAPAKGQSLSDNPYLIECQPNLRRKWKYDVLRLAGFDPVDGPPKRKKVSVIKNAVLGFLSGAGAITVYQYLSVLIGN